MTISPPPYRDKDLTSQSWQKWFASITDSFKTIATSAASAATSWSGIDKTGSNLADIQTRNHDDLQNLNTPTHVHLTSTEHAASGMIKGSGTGYSAAIAGTDYSAGTSALATGIIKSTTGSGALSIAVAATDYVAPSAYASANGLTMSTARLLGRTTAATGAAEEISIGANLTLSAGVLSAGASAAISNVISSPTTISADTSYTVISYLTNNSDLTNNGNLMVIG